MTIEMLHATFAGANPNRKTVAEISKPDFWTNAYKYGEVIKREFPGNGRNTYYMGVKNGSLAGTWSRWNGGGIYMDQSHPKEKHLVRFKKSTPQLVDAQ